MTRHRGRWTLRTAAPRPGTTCRWTCPRAARAAGELDYDRSAATLDLGCLGPAGFRGWSGGARAEFVITPGAATPGYLPGELEPGRWQVILGLYRLAAGGAAYAVTAEVTSVPGRLAPPPGPAAPPPLGQPAAAPRPARPARAGAGWPGTCTRHTVHSDGELTVPELARFAAEQGLDFLAITDHNTVSHHAELGCAARRYGITLIPGQEVTTEAGSRRGARRHRLGRLPRARRRLAGGDGAGRRAAVGEPPDRRPRELDPADAAAAPAGRDLALELAGPALDRAAGLVAGLGRRGGAGGRQ